MGTEKFTVTNIDGTRCDPGQFATSELLTEINDNIKNLLDAMYSYDGQVRVYSGNHPHSHDGTNSAIVDLADNQVLTDKIADDQITAAKMENWTAGDYIVIFSKHETELGSGTYAKIFEGRVDRDGELRIKFDLRASGGGYTAMGKIYQNGSPVGTERTVGSGETTFSEDLSSWVAGDLVQVYAKRGGAGGGQAWINDFKVFVAELPPATITDADVGADDS